MPDWTRRDLLKASAGAAAVAVPMAALSGTVSAARPSTAAPDALAAPAALRVGDEPVMFCIHDARRGEVSILHGTDEVVVRDPQLVTRIMRVANVSPKGW